MNRASYTNITFWNDFDYSAFLYDAADLRREVHALLTAGKSDAEIRAFMTDRYGDFVLYNPPVTGRTYLLWAAPAILLAIGLLTAFLIIRRRSRAVDSDPDEVEEVRQS